MGKSSRLSALTNDWLKARGYVVIRNTEWVNCHTGLKHDLFGFADKIALRKDPEDILLVQFTTQKGSEHRKHFDKITKEPKVWPYAKLCLQLGIRILLISWLKVKGRWTFKMQYIKLSNFKPIKKKKRYREVIHGDP